VDNPRVDVLEQIRVPTQPVNSFSWRDAILEGAGTGLALGLGLVALAAALTRNITSIRQLKAAANVPVAATFPQLTAKKRRKQTQTMLTSEVDAGFAEALRGLGLKVRKELTEKQDKVIVVTSTISGEGKTTTAANLAMALSEDGSRVVLVDADLRNQSLGRIYGGTGNGLMDCLKNEKLDAVIIASPDQLHKEMVYAAIDADLHIMCEKPLALTREDCEEIVAAVKKSTKKFMVGQICRYTPGFVKANELIDAGEIGELTFVESEYAHDYTHVLDRKDGSWRCDPTRSGVVGGGCHAVDLLRWIAGNPEEIMAYGVHKTFSELVPYDDTHVAVMKFPNGVVGRVFVSIGCQSPGTGIRTLLYGTKGTIIRSAGDRHITLYLADFGFEKSDKILGTSQLYKNGIQIPVALGSHNTAAELEEFVDIIKNDKEVAVSAREGADTVAVCVAAIRSTETGLPANVEYCK
jgi:predicted dehydrogenase